MMIQPFISLAEVMKCNICLSINEMLFVRNHVDNLQNVTRQHVAQNVAIFFLITAISEPVYKQDGKV